MFDSHCHINDDILFNRRKEVIENASLRGVKGFLCVGWDIESSKKSLQIASEFENVYAAVGIHPENIDGYEIDALKEIESLAKNTKVVAIGEIGLDYHWRKDNKEIQKLFFAKQIELANRLSLPITIHARDAIEDVYELLSNNEIENGFSLHCFSGSTEMLKKFSSRFDCYFGFDGPVTYKNAITPKECAALCPANRILLETDCPYLPPVPHRGERNEPKYLQEIADEIATLRHIDVSELIAVTDENAKNLFHVEL